jgi:hypothetical protein
MPRFSLRTLALVLVAGEMVLVGTICVIDARSPDWEVDWTPLWVFAGFCIAVGGIYRIFYPPSRPL